MATPALDIVARHIQNFSEAATLQPHWGYAARALPCTNDAGSCEYLDTVYHSHDLSVLYSFILWAAIGGCLLIWGFGRRIAPRQDPKVVALDENAPRSQHSSIYRLSRAIKAATRRLLLPDGLRSVFGRVTRLQILTLLVLSGYLIVFSFVGIVYKKWVTPVKKLPGVYNTRTGLGPWADRVGVLAYALIPLSVLLSSRESLLSLITGVSYQHFNFLHRWLGYIIFAQSVFHTIGWTIVEARLYQPQPSVWNVFIAQLYMIWGVIAFVILCLLVALSTPWGIKLTGYEFFRKAHYVLAMLFIGGCWGHWQPLSCWLIASLVVWLLDRSVRLIRTALLHYNYLPGSTTSMGLQNAKAIITHFPDQTNGDVVRLDFSHNHGPWKIGQHFYLCFPELSIWQSHPFTPSSLPGYELKFQPHTYIMRAKKGETKRLADLASKKQSTSLQVTTPVVLAGPYGESTVKALRDNSDVNVLCVAGGTGITFVMPVLMHLINQPHYSSSSDRRVELIWAIRKRSDMYWMKKELDMLYQIGKRLNVNVRVFVTRDGELDNKEVADVLRSNEKSDSAYVTVNEDEISSSTPSSASDDGCDCISTAPNAFVKSVSDSKLTKVMVDNASNPRRPDLSGTVKEFVHSTIRGPTSVYASGPGGMISDLRDVVASCNSGAKVWRGDERYDVELIHDDRLEW